MRILVTGAAGFIGFHLTERLLADGHEVAGVDGMTPYYDPALKAARLARLAPHNGFSFETVMLQDMPALTAAFERAAPEVIVHLAAQAGVRYSLENPGAYVDANLVGTFNVLELARQAGVRHLLYASTSSIYGVSEKRPFAETDPADHPLTLYAASKKAGELMSHSYSHLWNIPTTAFRFFTVYGPWGRPDMAPWIFADAIAAGRPIEVHNEGEIWRDFTYVDDLVEAIVRLIPLPPVKGQPVAAIDSLSPVAPWRVVNIGRGEPVKLTALIDAIETALGRTAERRLTPMQPGDVPLTFASAELLHALTGYRPTTPLNEGAALFCDWFSDYHNLANGKGG
ncbi:MAG TPA: NAD-dependent epimerase/dehydratase family protein [Caulobacteraceae bacterium]|jgi:UDP-glucuronate 4-epimerase|nr:NAD-dependent epimerase/dehydratase family protein [Caulobacteraceae bacterium]